MFKKKSLKFTYAEIRRDTRHAEALKARESSRFKRLSMIRSIVDSDVSDFSMEADVKSIECEKENVTKPLSRLEKLFRWKQEKQLRKELDEKAKKKPFYVGKSVSDNKNLEVLKSSFINQSSLKLNSSRIVKSKLLAPSIALQKKILNSPKQLTSNINLQSSRIPYTKQIPKPISNVSKTCNTFTLTKKNVKSDLKSATSIKKPISVANTVKNDKVPITKNTPNDMKKTNNFPKPVKQPISVGNTVKNDKVPITKNTPNNMKKTNNFPKPIKQPISVANTVKNDKLPITKNTPNDMKKTNNFPKPIKQVSSASKVLPTLPNKTVTKVETVLSKSVSNATSLPKGIPVQKFQSKMPVSNVIQKFPTASKFSQKDSNHSTKNEPAKKGHYFKKVVVNSRQQQETDILNIVPKQSTIEKVYEKCIDTEENHTNVDEKEDVELKFTKPELLSEKRQEDIPDLTFNSDISVIKSTSFAPPDFRFEPPEGLDDFTFDDYDDDPYKALELVKQKFMSRTSTPNKSTERKSSHENSKDSVYNDGEKSSVNCSNNIDISVMNPEINFKSDDKSIYDEPVNQNISEVVSDVITKFEDTEDKGNNSLESLPDKSANQSSENAEKISEVVNPTVHICENQPNEPVETSQNRYVENETMEDSLLDTIDLSNISDIVMEKKELIELEEEDNNEADVLEDLDNMKITQRKSGGAKPKKLSILKNMTVLNSIAETSETDDCSDTTALRSAKKNQISVNTPQHTKRISGHHSLDILLHVDSPDSGFSGIPRRSLRLQKMSTTKNEVENSIILSPFGEKKSNTLRRSMRLINLNTPEKDDNKKIFHSNLTQDFDKLSLNNSENMDPDMLLIDLDSPRITPKLTSKKVSLLYSPVKTRKSIRKSIKGDLMTFSPSS